MSHEVPEKFPEIDIVLEKTEVVARERKLKGNWRLRSFPCGCTILYNADDPENANIENMTHEELGFNDNDHQVWYSKEALELIHGQMAEEISRPSETSINVE